VNSLLIVTWLATLQRNNQGIFVRKIFVKENGDVSAAALCSFLSRLVSF
jgi:hypothetical protein